jgi:hypothetical protein
VIHFVSISLSLSLSLVWCVLKSLVLNFAFFAICVAGVAESQALLNKKILP